MATIAHDWEENTFAGLEELDDRGHERVSQLGRAVDDDEPEMVATTLPAMDAIELDDTPHLA